ncbi:MAG: leucine-rich repeat domain-containing protein [Prevotella sp.]|nr:leucine-rich repeat domain-containing protein [Prevotella sp.]
MKRLLSLSLFLMTAMLSFAHDFEVDGIYYNITSYTAPYTVAVTYQGAYHSQYSNEYTGDVAIPKSVAYCGTTYSVTAIDGRAFSDCSNLTSVVIPNCVTEIGSSAFDGCSGLTSVEIPNSVTSISNSAFAYCSSLTSISISNCVWIIGDCTFYGCSGLTTVEIPISVTEIGGSVFYGCSSLTSITIPNSVTSIGWGAFRDCSGLKEITSYIQEPFATDSYCWYNVNKSIPLYIPKGSKEKYQTTDGWKEFTNFIEFGGESIVPATEPQEVDMAVVPDQMDLHGMVVGYTYYVLDADNGDGADSENGCVVINTTTTDGAIDGIAGKDVSDASVKAAFKGIIFMVPAGTGTISINAETLGTSSLMVKIGSQPAQAFQLAERETVEIPYSVAEPTYVYIYAGTGIQAARSVGAARAAVAENSVKVYSYKWEPADPTGINSVDNSQSATGNEAGDWYTIDGRKLSGKPAQKGIYIVNGRKVAVK